MASGLSGLIERTLGLTATESPVLPEPHTAQTEVMQQAKRFNVLVCGRRWGKTMLAERKLVECALEGKPAAYICPTYRMLTEVWRDVARLLPGARKLVSEYRIELANGGTIEMWSGDDAANAIRGRKYALVILDEAALIPALRVAWEQSIRPTLTDLRGEAWFISTPRRGGTFEELYNDAVGPEWARWQQPTSANPFMPADEIQRAQEGMSEQAFKQEYLADFEASESDLVHILERDKTLFPNPEGWKACKYRIGGIDPGGGDPTAIVPIGVTSGLVRGHAEHLHQYGEFYRRNDASLDRIAGYLSYWHNQAPFDLIAVGETGGNILTNSLVQLGFPAVKADMRREEGIERMKWAYESGILTINPECRNSIAEFANYRYAKRRDGETGERYATKVVADHHADAMDARRYAVLTFLAGLPSGWRSREVQYV